MDSNSYSKHNWFTNLCFISRQKSASCSRKNTVNPYLQVDPAGPLSNLKKLFLDGELVNAVKEFLTTHWYVGLAAGLGFVIIIVSNLSNCLLS